MCAIWSVVSRVQGAHAIVSILRMKYIEENLTVRGRPKEDDRPTRPHDPQEELYRISDRWKVNKKEGEEGSVTNSLSMLTAIPEVDLGIEFVVTIGIWKLSVANIHPQHSAQEYRGHRKGEAFSCGGWKSRKASCQC